MFGLTNRLGAWKAIRHKGSVRVSRLFVPGLNLTDKKLNPKVLFEDPRVTLPFLNLFGVSALEKNRLGAYGIDTFSSYTCT